MGRGITGGNGILADYDIARFFSDLKQFTLMKVHMKSTH